MKVAIIGTGNVGLVSGACFASIGHRVTCVDLDPARVAAIEQARAPFFEPGLDALLDETAGRSLTATLDLSAAVAEAEVILLAVGTPVGTDGHDLRQVRAATRQVGEALATRDDYPLVMVKSTVLPGTTDGVVVPILEDASGRRAGVDFGVAMNPEFLREGQAVEDFLHPDRLVFGGRDARCWKVQERLYEALDCPDIVHTDNATAEMIKMASNSLLATLISFSNEMANLAATLPGVDVVEVLRGVHLDKRLSPILSEPVAAGERLRPGILSYLMPGCGFGGSCLPKDTRSLAAFGEGRDRSMAMLRATIAINDAQPGRVVELIERHLPSLDGVEVAVLGLSFKPGTSDIRRTPALPVIASLRERGARLRLYDPEALDEVRAHLGEADEVVYTGDLDAAIEDAAVLVVLTGWPEIVALPERLKACADPPLVIDGRRLYEPGSLARYDAIGLGPSGPGVGG
ncbi:MAG: UDP-glucose/GDP-mannose dehydrogenase family protein [Acidobacteriota bacterium]